jgi:phosphoribosylaminoimidazole-succinocarboxamide synthase
MLTQTQLIAAIPDALTSIDVPHLGPKHEGKVRDSYVGGGQRILITTDRVSAFDRVVGAVPYKGQLLNQLSAWWFEQLADVVPSHFISMPDPNVTIAREAQALSVEVVVRGHITGSTSTSLWTLYNAGVEKPYGLDLPKGLNKNDLLPDPVITPTTKAPAGAHDERLTEAEVVARGLVPAPLWNQVRTAGLAAFKRGQQRARAAGMMLVDTKYEFGLIDGALALIDEVHTPDCSRYWSRDSFEATRKSGAEPDSFDKEHLRLWFAQQGYRGDGPVPPLPPPFVADLASRYISVYERLTGQAFVPSAQPAGPRIRKALESLA